ncbi:PucR family transcriptional regulator [Glutamicibacter soli]
MAIREDSSAFHTVCPEGSTLTVEQLLRMPSVLVGRPQVFATPDELLRTIGWAHILENFEAAEFLRGNELVLTTAIGWDEDPDFERYAASMAQLNVAALVLELSERLPAVPQGLVDACNNFALPLIVMHRPVAFVEITEAIHQWLFAQQTQRVKAGREITEHFTKSMHQGTPTDAILIDCARMLSSTVLLEDSGYNIQNYASVDILPGNYFEQWQHRSRASHNSGNSDRHAVPIRMHGKLFGSLICPKEAAHPAGVDHVLTMAATAIGADLLRRPESRLWSLGTGRGLLEDLQSGMESNLEFVHGRLEAAGLPIDDSVLQGFAIRLSAGHDIQRAAQELERTLCPLASCLVGLIHAPHAKLFGLLSHKQDSRGPLDEAPLREIHSAPHFEGALYLGPAAVGLAQGQASMNQAVAACELGLNTQDELVNAGEYPLALLAHELRHEPSMQRLPQEQLAGILALESSRRFEYLRVLEACLASLTNRSQAASLSHLSRSVFYQRLATLEQLLGADLNDAQTLTILTLSLLIYRQSHQDT